MIYLCPLHKPQRSALRWQPSTRNISFKEQSRVSYSRMWRALLGQYLYLDLTIVGSSEAQCSLHPHHYRMKSGPRKGGRTSLLPCLEDVLTVGLLFLSYIRDLGWHYGDEVLQLREIHACRSNRRCQVLAFPFLFTQTVLGFLFKTLKSVRNMLTSVYLILDFTSPFSRGSFLPKWKRQKKAFVVDLGLKYIHSL